MFQKIKHVFSNSDYWTLGLVCLLSAIGMFAIYSAGYDPSYPEEPVQGFYQRQMVWFSLGIFIFFFMSFINYKKIVRFAPFIYATGILFLILVLINGHIGMGAQRWIGVGPIRVQPSEIFKVVWVITLAWLFMNFDDKSLGFFKIVKKSVFLIPPFLLVFLQPDLGTSSTYLAIWGLIILFFGVSRTTLVVVIVLAAIIAPVGWSHLHDYQKKRVVTFLNPENDPFGAGYHIIQSKIGVGSGGINGKGYMKGTQSHLRFIPERHTDFIFSVISEEFGLIGCLVIISLFLLLTWRLLRTGIQTRDPAGKVLVTAIAFYIFFQFTVNSYMIVGMMPVVGIPMPFVSYGGSSLMSFFAMLGLVNSVYLRRFSAEDDLF